MKVLVIGSINKDIVFDVKDIVKDGQTISSSGQTEYLGGKGLNQTIAISNVLDDVYFYCNVNENDAYILESLEEYNFKTDYIQKVKEPTGTAFIQVNEHGENAIVISKNANSKIDLSYLESVLNDFNSNDLILLQNEINNLVEIVEQCHKRKLKIALNPSPISSDITLELISKIDYLIANKNEFLEITNSENIDDALNVFRSKNTTTELVITLGSKGAFHELNKTTMVDGIKTNVVDTTCAGDTFLGFFLGSIFHGKPISDSLVIANKAASKCVQTKGASTSIPKLKDLK